MSYVSQEQRWPSNCSNCGAATLSSARCSSRLRRLCSCCVQLSEHLVLFRGDAGWSNNSSPLYQSCRCSGCLELHQPTPAMGWAPQLSLTAIQGHVAEGVHSVYTPLDALVRCFTLIPSVFPSVSLHPVNSHRCHPLLLFIQCARGNLGRVHPKFHALDIIRFLGSVNPFRVIREHSWLSSSGPGNSGG
jgi:hypothetical protein